MHDVDFGSDGNAAVAVGAQTGESGFLHGILLLNPSGTDASFIDTGRYVPAYIAIAPDRTIWTLGWQMDPQKIPYPDRQDYKTVPNSPLMAKK